MMTMLLGQEMDRTLASKGADRPYTGASDNGSHT